MPAQPLTILYTNYKGEVGVRKIVPERCFLGSNEWHPETQWLMDAHDVEKQAKRTFAMKDIHWMGLGDPPAGHDMMLKITGDKCTAKCQCGANLILKSFTQDGIVVERCPNH